MDRHDDVMRTAVALDEVVAVPTLLKVLCEMTGLRFAAVTRTTEAAWIACAVHDELQLGIQPGDSLAFVSRPSADPPGTSLPMGLQRGDRLAGTALRGKLDSIRIESIVSAPILLANGHLFGAVCAFDSRSTTVEPRMVPLFGHFAGLIAAEIEQQAVRAREHATLLDERATSELREQFIAVLGHDLRNPLQAVFGSSDLLERKLSDPAQRAIASRIKVQVIRMSALINDVLDFARGQLGGGIALELADVGNLSLGLLTVVQELQDARPDAQIVATINISHAVRCDLSRLQQVASNLLGNALTHGRSQSTVKLTARTDEENFILEVWNEGDPIPPASLRRIFEPFWRDAGSSRRNGLGLGLHICSQIMRAHDGSMSVTSSREHGTQFTARLPLRRAHAEPLSVEAP